MTMRAIRCAAVLLLALWIGACTNIGHITVGKAGEKGGFAELRIVRPAPARGPNLPPGSRVPSAQNAISEYWKTVQDCAAQARAAG